MFSNGQPMKRTRSPSVNSQVNRHAPWPETIGDLRAVFWRALPLAVWRLLLLKSLTLLALLALLAMLTVMPTQAVAQNGPQWVAQSAAKPPATPAEVLGFHEFFQTPIGPRGLALSAKTRSLQDQRVSLTGYRVKTDVPTVGWFLLAPLPNQVSPEEDGDANDLPANTVLVTLAPLQKGEKGVSVSPTPILGESERMTLKGRFHWGAERAPDGQTYWFSLQLNEP